MRSLVFIVVLSLVPQLALADSFKDFNEQMKFLAQRDRVIAQNIANADTPGYIPMEIKKKGSSSSESQIRLRRTDSMHFDVNEEASEFEMVEAQVEELKPNGNGVTLQSEVLKKTENSMQMHETVNLYNKARAMLKTAIVGLK